MHSCLYAGRVAHVRREPVIHRFRYSVAMAYIDLDEAAGLVRASRLLSGAKFAPWSFRAEDHARHANSASDHAAPSALELADAVRDEVARNGGRRPAGPVRLLTQLRQWGVYFSPLNLFYCFDAAGERVEAVLAEVSNTPWNERRRYVLDDSLRVNGRRDLRFSHAKDFHVSPFMGISARYDWRLTAPGDRLRVHIRSTSAPSRAGPAAPFDASMALKRRPWSERGLATMACRFPAANVQILAAIYWQAFRLWTKRCPYFPHPRSTGGQT